MSMRFVAAALGTVGFSVLGLLAMTSGASAQVKTADVGINPTFEQTGATTVISTGGFFSARAFLTNSTDYATGTLTYGGSGSPATLSYVPADVALEYGDSNASFAALQALYPSGAYTFDLTGGTQPETAFSIDYSGDAYSNAPELTASSFSGLQGVSSSTSYTVDFNDFLVNPNATSGAIYFTIDNASGAAVFSSTLDASATSVTIPGASLLAGETYTFDLLFDDRIAGEVDGIETTQFYDTHTYGTFTTAVPEPSTWAMMLLGFAGLSFAGYRASRKTAAGR